MRTVEPSTVLMYSPEVQKPSFVTKYDPISMQSVSPVRWCRADRVSGPEARFPKATAEGADDRHEPMTVPQSSLAAYQRPEGSYTYQRVSGHGS